MEVFLILSIIDTNYLFVLFMIRNMHNNNTFNIFILIKVCELPFYVNLPGFEIQL